MIEPSDYERAGLPDTSREYMEDLERERDALAAHVERLREELKTVLKIHMPKDGYGGDSRGVDDYLVSITVVITETPAQSLRHIESRVEEETIDQLKPVMINLYNQGYNAGHHDTVEGGYTYVYPVDMNEYHSDIVENILNNESLPRKYKTNMEEEK